MTNESEYPTMNQNNGIDGTNRRIGTTALKQVGNGTIFGTIIGEDGSDVQLKLASGRVEWTSAESVLPMGAAPVPEGERP